MNLQHVAKHGFEMYLAKYISKPESSLMLNYLKIQVTLSGIYVPE